MTALDIKKYLRENEITYEQLALKAGVSLYTLHNMLNGSTKTPLIGTVKSVMEALGFSVEDFEYAKNYPTRHFDLELWKKTKKEKKITL